MAEKVFPSSKPPTINGTATAPAAKTTAAANTNANKPKLHNPTARPPYRPQPHNHQRRRSRGSGRRTCCCCCFWSILILLLLLLLAAIAGAALYVLYRPHRPAFSIPSIRIHRVNLTAASADSSSSSHISTLLNLTVISNNPNSHLSFFYEPFTISSFSSNVFIGNGTLPPFSLTANNETTFRNVVVSGSNDLDGESVNALRSDLKKKNGRLTLKIQLDTKMRVKMGGLKTKNVGIRVTCGGIKGVVPEGKSPTVAVTTGSKCKVDLRIKIWRFTI